jgi:glycosyltransferase involved in cell wall biosynthesis
MKPIFNVAVIADNSIGGTEKAAVLYAVELASRGHQVTFITRSGPRDQALEQGNVRRIDPPADAHGLAHFLKTERIDVIHQHVPGSPMPNPIYEALKIFGEKRPRLIETNVFGLLEDPAGDQWVDFRCFISCSSAVQAFQRSGRSMTSESLRNMTTIYYTLPPLDAATQQRSRRNEMRAELGIRPQEIFIVRFGRASRKWNRDEVAVFQQAHRQNPLLRMLLMQPPKDIWDEVESGRWGEGILLRPALSDFDRLAAIYTAADLSLHMVRWGESYGYTLAEAMQHGLPLIVRSTPWGDNAQVELVEHGKTGLVCNSCGGATDALLGLAGDAKLLAQFGTNSIERIGRLSNVTREGDLLEEIINHLVRGEPLKKVTERNRELLEFNSSFSKREKTVWELNNPKLRFFYWQGACFTASRQLRSKAGLLKRRLKRLLAASQ